MSHDLPEKSAHQLISATPRPKSLALLNSFAQEQDRLFITSDENVVPRATINNFKSSRSDETLARSSGEDSRNMISLFQTSSL